MGNLKTQNTSYPGTLDTATTLSNSENSDVAQINGPVSAILALETELGTDIAGSRATLKERLQSIVDAAGGLLKGSDFPVSPEAVPHLFWHTVALKLYIYNISTAQYVQIPVSTDLAGYLTTSTPATITARHTFSTSTIGAPFTVSGNSMNQKVTGLNADAVDGHDLNQDVSTTSSPTFVTATTTTSVATNTITERTAASGVTVDGCLIKDGVAWSYSPLMTIASDTLNVNQTVYLTVMGGEESPINTNEYHAEQIIPFNGTIYGMRVKADSNTASVSCVITLRVNRVDTALTATIPSTGTAEVTDLIHSVNVVAGDRVCWKIAQAAGTGSTNYIKISAILKGTA